MDVTILNKFLQAVFGLLRSSLTTCVVTVGAPDSDKVTFDKTYVWISPNFENEPHLYNYDFAQSDTSVFISSPTLGGVLDTYQSIRNMFNNVELSLGEGFVNINTYAPHGRFFEDIYEGKRRFFGQIVIRQRSGLELEEEEEGEEE